MQKKLAIPIILFILFVLLACDITSEGINFSNDDQLNRLATGTALQELVNALPEEDPSSGIDAPPPVVEPTRVMQPTVVTDPIPVQATNTTTEYSVTAQNFDCICQETGTVTEQLSIVGDQLHIGNMVYDNVGGNTYKRTWMGYYILVSGEGDNKTETQVEEARSTVIILTDTGYIMENYQGDSGSACCIYTFTKNQ